MRYLSVCSGIEAATVAWHPLGWTPVAFAEIEKFPSAVLAHHYPTVPNWGDMTKFQEWPDACNCNSGSQQPGAAAIRRWLEGRRDDVHAEHSGSTHDRDLAYGATCAECGGAVIDLLVGGTPCQSFSVAGLRKGLADPRGNLALTYLAIADKYRPEWLVWENVPGVLSSGDGRDFGAFLGGLVELGYGWAYRVLDAQYFGVAQRRRRVFVVASLRGWQRAAAVLFDSECLCGNPAPRREAGERPAGTLKGGSGERGYPDPSDGNGGGLIAFSRDARGDELKAEDVSTLTASQAAAAIGMQVRRLTPRECERLQGFPDDYTLVLYRGKPAADGPRYKALGNSMAVPCMRWIGRRIQMVAEINKPEAKSA